MMKLQKRYATYYKTREEAQARLGSAKAEFPPGSVVTTKSGNRLRIKDWFVAKPGPGGMGVYQASVLAEGPGGDVWVNVNDLKQGGQNTETEDRRVDDQATEIALEQGMLHGVNAYNDAMGYSLEGPGDCSWCLRPMVRGHHGCSCDDDE